MFEYIKEGLCGGLYDWKDKFLNQAGKEIMLKSIAMALPSYIISVSKLPK